MRTRNESLGSVFDGVFYLYFFFTCTYPNCVDLKIKKNEKELVFTHRHVTYACG